MSDLMKNKFLVCIDSDGCAIDSMTVKHERAFGPAFVELWDVAVNEKVPILKEWNHINLYTMTRGINRFQGLVAILKRHPELEEQEQLDKLVAWTESTKALSPVALRVEYEQTGLKIMAKALSWSVRVNEIIEALPLAQPFAGVKEALELIKSKADIAVVSSANPAAIEEEWKTSKLYDLVDYFFSQADGTKSECIKKLITKGYNRQRTIMIGDAIGDYEAAENNQVWFYPILATKESTSWQEFNRNYLPLFLKQQLKEEIQEKLFLNMKENLS